MGDERLETEVKGQKCTVVQLRGPGNFAVVAVTITRCHSTKGKRPIGDNRDKYATTPRVATHASSKLECPKARRS